MGMISPDHWSSPPQMFGFPRMVGPLPPMINPPPGVKPPPLAGPGPTSIRPHPPMVSPPPMVSGGVLGGPMSEEQVEQELMQVDQNLRPNHIILITVLNAQCPIGVQVISRLTQPIGRVLRIVVFKCGTAVQSMVEFDNIQTATAAKNKLHGCDIYRRSCTLKVEFAKTDRLNVKRNDDMTWDFTDECVLHQGFGQEEGEIQRGHSGTIGLRLRRWSFFHNNGMVMFFFQGTIAIDGFSMVLPSLDHHH